jgi:hypothetical protein
MEVSSLPPDSPPNPPPSPYYFLLDGMAPRRLFYTHPIALCMPYICGDSLPLHRLSFHSPFTFLLHYLLVPASFRSHIAHD